MGKRGPQFRSPKQSVLKLEFLNCFCRPPPSSGCTVLFVPLCFKASRQDFLTPYPLTLIPMHPHCAPYSFSRHISYPLTITPKTSHSNCFKSLIRMEIFTAKVLKDIEVLKSVLGSGFNDLQLRGPLGVMSLLGLRLNLQEVYGFR